MQEHDGQLQNCEKSALNYDSHFNPAQSLDRATLAHPKRKNLIYGEEAWTVWESAHATRQIAELLREIGVKEGERVALISHNSPYHMLIHAACSRIGAVFVPISYRLQCLELKQLLEICTPSVIVMDPETLLAEKILLDDFNFSAKIKGLFYLDDDPHGPEIPDIFHSANAVRPFSREYKKYFGKLISVVDNACTEIAENTEKPNSLSLSRVVYPAGLAAILFTSGSVGMPKAVGLTHEQLYWGSQNFRDGFEYSTVDIELVVAPLTHIGGFNGTTLDLFSHGGTVVVMREFDPALLLKQIERHKVTMMFGVPTIYAKMLETQEKLGCDISSFRLPLIGGAVTPKSLLQRMLQAGLKPINVWGMTETSASGFCLSSDNCADAIGSIGVPFPRIAARVIDPHTGEDTAESGELILCGPSVITQYWQDEKSTSAGFINSWLRTGDLVKVDTDGNFWVTGRINNLINTGGEKVSPEEVENLLNEYPGVSECVVVGIPDTQWGESVAAAVVMQNEMPVPEIAQLRDFARGKLASYKLPKVVQKMPKFPTTANGKVDRVTLSKILAGQQVK